MTWQNKLGILSFFILSPYISQIIESICCLPNGLFVSKTLKEIENVLSPSLFCRVHNSHLVNINFIKKFIKGDINLVVMHDDAEVEVSRRKKDELLKKIVKRKLLKNKTLFG